MMHFKRKCNRRYQIVSFFLLLSTVILLNISVVHGFTTPQKSRFRRYNGDSTKFMSSVLPRRGSVFRRERLTEQSYNYDHRGKRCLSVGCWALGAASSSDPESDNHSKNITDEASRNKIKPSGFAAIKGGLENIIKKTGFVDEDYEFGDITRRAVTNVTEVAVEVTEDTIRTITGDEEYKFGDITKGMVATSAENNIGLAAAFVLKLYLSLSSSGLAQRFKKELLPETEEDITDEEKAISNTLQVCSFLILAVHFVFNLCHSCSVVLAWGYTWWKMRATPLQSSTASQVFFTAQNFLRVVVGPWLLPLQAGLTFFGCIHYRDMTLKLEQRLIMRKKEKHATAIRFLALFLSYIFVNCIGMAICTSLGCYSLVSMLRCFLK